MGFVRNQYGIEVKAWCISCGSYRECICKQYVTDKLAHDGKHRQCWEMSDKYARLGRSNGDNTELRKLVHFKSSGVGKIKAIYDEYEV